MSDFKVIHDSIYGAMRVEPLELALMETLEMQRLNGIKQLGLSYLVFPGANHTRIEHSLGVSHLAKRISYALSLDASERNLLVSAGLLHDVGHGPFSHTLETTLEHSIGMNHMDLTKRVIIGADDIICEEERSAFQDIERIPDVLESYDLDPKQVASLVSSSKPPQDTSLFSINSANSLKEKNYLTQLVNSPIDIDQIDYLLRDAYYTGVAHGIIDVDRLIQTMAIYNNNLVVDAKGLSALEGMFVARALMFSSVYFHKTVRIAELMIARAVEKWDEIESSTLQRMVDSELMSSLISQGGFQKEIALKIKYRKLFKKAYVGRKQELSDEQLENLRRFEDARERMKTERELCRRAGAPDGYVIVDYPIPEIKKTEPRIFSTDVRILERDKVRYFKSRSEIGKVLERRDVTDWSVMVATDRAYLSRVSRIAPQILFES